MFKFDFLTIKKPSLQVTRYGLLTTILAMLLVSTACLIWYLNNDKKEQIIIAAGPHSSLSYEIIGGIEKLLQEDYGIEALMVETRDGEENAHLLEEGLVQLAVVPAKNLHGEQSRLVASLYPASYHLMVHSDSDISHFTQLKGKKIAMQVEGGTEHEAFLELAAHYGLHEKDLSIYASTDKASDWLFNQRQVDAIFRIRAPGDPSVKNVIKRNDVTLIPINQVEGIRINSPTRNPSVIANGIYQGHPSMPSENIQTISENELLIAHKDVSADVVAMLSTTLFEDRKKLTNIAPMSAFIKQPKKDSEQLIPIHQGVRQFWDRTEPPFLQRNADVIATVSSLIFLVFSMAMWFRKNQRKNVIYEYNRRLMNIAVSVKCAESTASLNKHKEEFDQFLIELLFATENGDIAHEDYSALSYSFEAAKSALNDKHQRLIGG